MMLFLDQLVFFKQRIYIRKERGLVSKQCQPQPQVHSKVMDTKPTTVKWPIVVWLFGS